MFPFTQEEVLIDVGSYLTTSHRVYLRRGVREVLGGKRIRTEVVFVGWFTLGLGYTGVTFLLSKYLVYTLYICVYVEIYLL